MARALRRRPPGIEPETPAERAVAELRGWLEAGERIVVLLAPRGAERRRVLDSLAAAAGARFVATPWKAGAGRPPTPPRQTTVDELRGSTPRTLLVVEEGERLGAEGARVLRALTHDPATERFAAVALSPEEAGAVLGGLGPGLEVVVLRDAPRGRGAPWLRGAAAAAAALLAAASLGVALALLLPRFAPEPAPAPEAVPAAPPEVAAPPPELPDAAPVAAPPPPSPRSPRRCGAQRRAPPPAAAAPAPQRSAVATSPPRESAAARLGRLARRQRDPARLDRRRRQRDRRDADRAPPIPAAGIASARASTTGARTPARRGRGRRALPDVRRQALVEHLEPASARADAARLRPWGRRRWIGGAFLLGGGLAGSAGFSASAGVPAAALRRRARAPRPRRASRPRRRRTPRATTPSRPSPRARARGSSS